MSTSGARLEFNEAWVDEVCAELDQCQLPGIALGIAVGGIPVYRKGFGLANIELPVLLTPSTRMRIGSTTKHFAALAFMLLCEDGKAHIDDPVGQYIPELNAAWRHVTMRQLMGHIAGIRDVYDLTFYLNGVSSPTTAADLLGMYQGLEQVNAPAGQCWDYNNGGYFLLSVAIERLANAPLEDVLKARIFDPVGMRDTLLRRSDNNFVPNSASTHMTKLGDFVAATGASPSKAELIQGFEKLHFGADFAGAGAMVSTVDDLLTWLAHMDHPRVGTAATWEAMKTPLALLSGATTGYGLGLITGDYRGLSTLSHPGGWLGGNAQLIKIDCLGLDIVAISNRHDVSAALLTNRIIDRIVAGLPPGAATEQMSATGAFCSQHTGRVVELRANGRTQIVSIDGCDWPFEWHGDGRLRPTSEWAFLNHELRLFGDPQCPDDIELVTFGDRDELSRLSNSDEDVGETISGLYVARSLNISCRIERNGAAFELVTLGARGSVGYGLEQLSPAVWRAQDKESPRAAVLRFNPKSLTFQFSTYHTWNLEFERVGPDGEACAQVEAARQCPS